MIECRLIVDQAADGPWNMALDEALLESVEQDNIAWLRFYAWREPTLSLGYFQKHSDRAQHPASADCALVRRSSGGGAILHDRELTYSIALPQTHLLARRAEQLYQAAHESLIETLAELGITAVQCEKPRNQSRNSEPFLCFQRRIAGDVLLGPHKIAGSAQRRHRGAVLQHGSVILSRSTAAPELAGIAELIGPEITFTQLRDLWQPRLAQRAQLDLNPTPPTAPILAKAEKIAYEKFASPHWTFRR